MTTIRRHIEDAIESEKQKQTEKAEEKAPLLRDRSIFGYMEPHPDTKEFANCSTCSMFLRKIGRCHWLGKDDEVDGDDSCIMYAQGEPNDNPSAKPIETFKPEVVGFYDGSVRCENCNASDARDPKKIHCDLYVQLNRMFPNAFKLETPIKPHACCNAFFPGKRDPKQFGPYGPLPDADDPKAGGLLYRLLKNRK